MKLQLKIDRVHVDGPHAYALATMVSGERLAVSQGSKLGGVRLRPFLAGVGRKCIFQIENPAEAEKLHVGDIVELI